MKPALIIIEGAQGVGKTTVTDYIRNKMPYTNLYRLSGHSDITREGYNKSKKMYNDLFEYMKNLENTDVNLLFDRTFFSEEVYTRLGYKEYSFTDLYEELLVKLNNLDFVIYYFVLYLKDEELFKERLDRKDKAKVKYVDFDISNSVKQQNMYLQTAKEVKEKCNNVKVYTLENDKTNQAIDFIQELFVERWKK